MQTKSLIALAALALAAGSTFADTNRPLTRADVQQAVIAARAAGQLRPAGEAGDDPFGPLSTRSAISRADVRQGIVEARAEGQLIPAGEGSDVTVATLGTGSQTTRAELRAEVLQARADGTLVPAGPTKEDDGERYAHADPARTTRLAGWFRNVWH
jgi:hypothetical protein